MKIVFTVSSLGAGGAERVATTLCNAWVERGYLVTLVPTFSERGDCFYELSPNINLVYLADLVSSRKRSLGNQLARLKALRKFISAERPDVIVSFMVNVNVATILASAGLGIPVIVCERQDPFVAPTLPSQRFARYFTYPFADALMVQTQAVAAKYAVSAQKLRRVRVIPNPLYEGVLEIRNRGSVGDRKCLIAVGRLDRNKQFDVLISVFARLVRHHVNWSLRIVGDGPLRSALQQQIVELGVDASIELSGQSANVEEDMADSDAFVLTSASEGFPNALLEAMAIGLPCVTFDCPSGPREMSMDGQVALLVPLNDEQALGVALERLMLDADLRQSLGLQARASVVERYALDKVLVQWDALFEDVAACRYLENPR
ncbi:MAG: glycosyltransferase family 4 protein [Methylococcales bacterium]